MPLRQSQPIVPALRSLRAHRRRRTSSCPREIPTRSSLCAHPLRQGTRESTTPWRHDLPQGP
eukprot:6578098-Heterocapsa_arctica.AAC.1